MQSNLTCTWFEVAANKNHAILSGRARDTGKLKNKAIFDSQDDERNAVPKLRRWLTTSSHVINTVSYAFFFDRYFIDKEKSLGWNSKDRERFVTSLFVSMLLMRGWGCWFPSTIKRWSLATMTEKQSINTALERHSQVAFFIFPPTSNCGSSTSVFLIVLKLLVPGL